MSKKFIILSILGVLAIIISGFSIVFLVNNENSKKSLNTKLESDNILSDVNSQSNSNDKLKDSTIIKNEESDNGNTLDSTNKSKNKEIESQSTQKSVSTGNSSAPISNNKQSSPISNSQGNTSSGNTPSSSSSSTQKEESISKPQVDLNAIDKTDPLYSSHLGRIQYSSYTECTNAGFQKSFEDGSNVKSFSCIEVNSVGRDILGYYLELRY